MSVALFNTHTFVKRLTAAGMPELQAEILADEHVKLIDERLATKADLANIATKADLEAVKADLAYVKTDLESVKTDLAYVKTDLEAVKTDLTEVKAHLANTATKVELAEFKADILKWMFGAIGFQTMVILGAVVLLLKFVKP